MTCRVVCAALVVLVLAGGCGVPALTAKDVGTITLTANQRNKCLLERDVVLQAKMSNGEVRQSGTESESKGIDLRKGVKLTASSGKVEIGGKQGERMWWTPPLLQSQLLEKGSVTITAVMTDDPSKKAELTFPIELGASCEHELKVGGDNGQDGLGGMSSTNYCQGIENGGDGAAGGNGASGTAGRIDVVVKSHPKLGDVVVYRATNGAGVEELLTRLDARVLINGRGGDGGNGGAGGQGCVVGSECDKIGHALVRVGNGGNGASGGNGGNGAELVVQLDPQHPELKNHIRVDVHGGKAGAAGAAGAGGEMNENYCKGRGRPGGGGRDGAPGRDGSVRLEGGGALADSGASASSTPSTTTPAGGREPANAGGDRPAKSAPGKEAWVAAGIKFDFSIHVENRTARDICSISVGSPGNLVSGSPLKKGATVEAVHVGNPKPPPKDARLNKLQVTAIVKSCDGKLTGSGPVTLATTDNTWVLYEGTAPKLTGAHTSVVRLKE